MRENPYNHNVLELLVVLNSTGLRRMTSETQPAPYGQFEDLNADDTPSRFNKSFSDELNIEERVAHYDTWAKTYDQDMKSYGFTGPEIAVEYLKRYFQDTNAAYLDCGAGTGLLGVHTKQLGYTNFHALDASSVALEKAKSRDAYSKFIQEFITTGQLSLETDVYDGLVCCGCFVPGHLEPDCVEDWCRIVKSGGIVVIVMNQRWLTKEPAYDEGKLEGAFQKRVDQGKWEAVVREQREGYFTNDVAEVFVFRVK